MISSITNLIHELPHELPNDLRLRTLGNWKISGKCQIRVEMQPSDNNCEKHTKLGNKILNSCSRLLDFFTSCQIFCTGLSVQFFGRDSTQSPSNLNFWTFSVTSKQFSNYDKNIKQVSCVKVPNLMVLC